MKSIFPDNFAWGTATASYQIEGGWNEEGKGRSIWDEFVRQPGKIGGSYHWAPSHGEVACDSFHRWPEDIALLKALGVTAYRFSLSWPRLLPEGTGPAHPVGIAHYRRMLEALREAGIEPWVTLYHWDLPLALHHRGGWLNRDSVHWFAEYAAVAARAYGDLVSHWITFNEPQVFVCAGYGSGGHAPGLRLSLPEQLRIGHHVMLAHGEAVRTLRSASPRSCRIGYAPAGVIRMAASEQPADIEAARVATFAMPSDNIWCNAWWNDPVVFGRYPEDGLKHLAAQLPAGWERDVEHMAPHLDFLGTNIYQGEMIQAGPQGEPVVVPFNAGSPLTAFKWNVTPEALRWGPRFLYERYRLPVVVTENGMSNCDWVHEDGTVPDPQRIDFMRRYLRALAQAVADGADVRGYFHWSLLDNFEWAEGYKERFGLVHVDFATLKRTPKQSFAFYGDIIRTRGACLHRTGA
jgi:beta-glucosidase